MTRELDGPWTAEESGAVDPQHRRQPTNSISVSQTSVPPTENWKGYEYRELLQRANNEHVAKETVVHESNESKSNSQTESNTNVKAQSIPAWTCYHPDSQNAQENARAYAAKLAHQDRPDPASNDAYVNRVGEQWQQEFRRIAKRKRVSDKKLDELEKTHLKPGADE